MNSIDRYEIRAAVFYQTTGYIAPGKDVSGAVWTETYEHNRQESWNDFNRVYIRVINLTMDECVAKLAAAESELKRLREGIAGLRETWSSDNSLVQLRKAIDALLAQSSDGKDNPNAQ